jgi:tRNA(fMet)-specific endonuclease VapC
LNGRSPEIQRKLLIVPAEDIIVCSVVRGELIYGAMKSRNPAQSIAKQQHFLQRYASLPYDNSAATEYRRIRTVLESNGTPIGPYDLQIAAIAIAHGLIVVTHNTREFNRIPGLIVEDWEI